MKNIILGIIGICITIYMILIGLNIYTIQTHKMQLNHTLSRVVQQALEEGCLTGDKSETRKLVKADIKKSLPESMDLVVDIIAIDLKRGVLSVAVTDTFSLVTGDKHSYTVEKTAILERQAATEEMVTITFLVDEENYKEYELVKGERCPLPKVPSQEFLGWVKYGSNNTNPVSSIGKVWEDSVYVALEK